MPTLSIDGVPIAEIPERAAKELRRLSKEKPGSFLSLSFTTSNRHEAVILGKVSIDISFEVSRAYAIKIEG